MASCIFAPHALGKDQTGGFQVLRRSHHRPLPQQPGGDRRSERMRKIQRDRCRSLGDGREFGEDAAWRVDGRRHLQRLVHAQAGGHRQHRADLRQQRRRGRGAVRPVRPDLGQAPGLARRPVALFSEWRALPAARHHRPVPGHRPGAAQLFHHRAGDDLAHHRGASRGAAGVSRGGGRHLQVQGAAPRDGEPHPPHPREPGTAGRRARRGGQAAPPSGAPGRHRREVQDPEGRRASGARRAAGPASGGHADGRGAARSPDRGAGERPGGGGGRAARGGGEDRARARRACRGQRPFQPGAGPLLRDRCRDRASRGGHPVCARGAPPAGDRPAAGGARPGRGARAGAAGPEPTAAARRGAGARPPAPGGGAPCRRGGERRAGEGRGGDGRLAGGMGPIQRTGQRAGAAGPGGAHPDQPSGAAGPAVAPPHRAQPRGAAAPLGRGAGGGDRRTAAARAGGGRRLGADP